MYLYPFYIYMASESKDEPKKKGPTKEEPKNESKKDEPKVIQDLETVWPAKKKRGKNIYLFWRNRPNSENHGHIFFHEDHKRWNYNIKCNNNKGNDRIRHNISQNKPARTLKSKIKEDWRKECPEFVKETSKKRKTNKKRKTYKKTNTNTNTKTKQ